MSCSERGSSNKISIYVCKHPKIKENTKSKTLLTQAFPSFLSPSLSMLEITSSPSNILNKYATT